MILDKDKVKHFMELLLDELQKEHWGDIDPIWLISEYENIDLVEVFSKTFKKFEL